MPSTQWKEERASGEEAEFARLAESLGLLQRKRASGQRALHAKMHGGFVARLEIPEALPKHLQHGLFARPGLYRACVRFSNGSGSSAPDHKPDVRGFSIKVLGVDGEKVLGDARTQDFLLIDQPTIPFRTPSEFVSFVEAVASGSVLGSLVRDLGLVGTLSVLGRVVKRAKRAPIDVADLRYHGPSAVAFGPYAARISATPLHVASSEHARGTSADYLGERLRARVAKEPLRFSLGAQLYEERGTPLDDPTSVWTSPTEQIARLTIDAQQPSEQLAQFVAGLRFDPWHALVEHRPLGTMMRARKVAYPVSTQQRAVVPEPDGSEWSTISQAGRQQEVNA